MATTVKGVVGGGGLTISASPATIDIPTGYLVDESNFANITRVITIPNKVKVISVSAYGENDNDIAHWEDRPIDMRVKSSNRLWYTGSDNGSTSFSVYIGVTPNKQYTIRANVSGADALMNLYIGYSPEINNETPTIYDY